MTHSSDGSQSPRAPLGAWLSAARAADVSTASRAAQINSRERARERMASSERACRAGSYCRRVGSMELTTYALADGVATITLDDGKVNALSPAMLTSIRERLDQAEQDGAIVVLTGRATT